MDSPPSDAHEVDNKKLQVSQHSCTQDLAYKVNFCTKVNFSTSYFNCMQNNYTGNTLLSCLMHNLGGMLVCLCVEDLLGELIQSKFIRHCNWKEIRIAVEFYIHIHYLQRKRKKKFSIICIQSNKNSTCLRSTNYQSMISIGSQVFQEKEFLVSKVWIWFTYLLIISFWCLVTFQSLLPSKGGKLISSNYSISRNENAWMVMAVV